MGELPRILIVDDEEVLLESLARAARARGFDAHTARGGTEAWSLLCRQRFDVVATDLRMPGVDGPELMGRMRAQGLAARVVVITGFATLEAAVDCLRKGAVDFLVKPFEVETFLKSLERALTRPSADPPAEPDWDRVRKTYGLTRRQLDIVREICGTGKTNRELAERLCLSPHTVKSHLKAAYAKLGVSTRAQLIQRIRQAQ
jgi:FixJ family two-component response regulator